MPTPRDDLRRAWVRGALAAAAGVVVGALLSGAYIAGRYEARLGRMARQTAELQDRLQRSAETAPDAIPAAGRIVDLLRDPTTSVYALRPTGTASAHGRVVWNPRAGGYLLAEGLPAAPGGRRYVLWALTPAGSRRTATLDVGPRTEARARIAPAPLRVEGFAVTLEPAEGGATPTGPTVLSSERS